MHCCFVGCCTGDVHTSCACIVEAENRHNKPTAVLCCSTRAAAACKQSRKELIYYCTAAGHSLQVSTS
jgi:hypothetical protein